MMYRHGMVFTGDRSSGIGCSRPRRRVFVVHAEISGTLVRVRVPSKSIFILFFPSLSLSLLGKFCRFFIRSLQISLTGERSPFLYSGISMGMDALPV